jgi:hypothetical protein
MVKDPGETGSDGSGSRLLGTKTTAGGGVDT